MSPIKILVVDDEPPMVELARGYLVREGWEVLTAGDGNEALEMARSEHADLVVLDLMLPGVDSIEVCRQICTFSDANIVMLTAKSEEVDKSIGLAVGADDYLTKPFSPRELVARILAIMRRARSSRWSCSNGLTTPEVLAVTVTNGGSVEGPPSSVYPGRAAVWLPWSRVTLVAVHAFGWSSDASTHA